jgi:hypothetical protein
VNHYYLNGRKFCSAKCDTADCSKRWTKAHQADAEGQHREPLLENMAYNCLAYTLPKFTKMGVSLKAGETNG